LPIVLPPTTHDWHNAPPMPQPVVAVGEDSQVVPEQHPVHEVLLQTHAPLTHSSPLPHGPPVVPHTHFPSEHVSASLPHVVHAPPFAPHAVGEGVVHVEPEQHPVVHVTLHPAHTSPLHMSVAAHLSQVPPPEPQASCALPGSQPPLSQHPLHVVPSHTHVPLEQCSPVGHAVPLPHVQAPLAEHPSPVVTPLTTHDSHAKPLSPQAVPVVGEVHAVPPVQHPVGHEVELQTHAPFEHVCPVPQGRPCPQLHAPADEQLSASLEVQTTHVTPSVPHVANAAGVHVLPLQQPLGHEVELQTHAPFTQTCPETHGADVPQLHLPAAEQLSALAEAHATQAAPLMPQFA
jgi:hypothetical protein